MTEIVFFALSVIGMTNIIVDSSLFAPVREMLRSYEKIHEMITCHQCAGFWCGLICGGIIVSYNPLWVFMGGCAGSFLASTFVLLSDWIVSKTDFVINDGVEDE